MIFHVPGKLRFKRGGEVIKCMAGFYNIFSSFGPNKTTIGVNFIVGNMEVDGKWGVMLLNIDSKRVCWDYSKKVARAYAPFLNTSKKGA